jgi:hypothetical protein
MEYVVVAFRSRAHTVKFYEILRANGMGCEIINTPKEAGVGCGLSVKVNVGQLLSVKTAVNKTALSSFAGFFLVKDMGGKRFVRSI